MRITIDYAGLLRGAVERGSETLDVPEPCTVAELLHTIASRDGAPVRDLLLDSEGAIQRSLLVAVDHQQLAPGNGHRLRDGERVTLMVPISGG